MTVHRLEGPSLGTNDAGDQLWGSSTGVTGRSISWARLLYRYCSNNVSGYKCHPVVAYSAEVAHRAIPIL